MATKLRLSRRIFDAAGHKSLQTQAYKVGDACSRVYVDATAYWNAAGCSMSSYTVFSQQLH
jgi:hypothetical protein